MDSLIDSLCENHKPKAKLYHPVICLGIWAVAAFASIYSVIWYIGVRHDIEARLSDPIFLFEMTLVVVMGLSALFCTFWLRIPDMRGKEWALPIPLTLLAVYCIWMFIRILTSHTDMPEMEYHHCMGDGATITVVPALLMFIMTLRGCTTRPLRMAMMNGLALAAIAYVGLGLTCASGDPGHVLFTHLLPFIVVAASLALLARKIYKW